MTTPDKNEYPEEFGSDPVDSIRKALSLHQYLIEGDDLTLGRRMFFLTLENRDLIGMQKAIIERYKKELETLRAAVKPQIEEMKYVVAKAENGPERLFVFSKTIDHDHFAEVLSYIKVGNQRHWKRERREVISAGFTDGITCYGRSETLDLDSRPGVDTDLLKRGG